jgi:outer membrane protein OmpU
MSYGYTMTDAAFSSTSVNIDMGDAGTIGVSNSAGQAGLPAYDSVIPTAGEEVWDDVDSDDNGIVTHSKVNSVDYMGSFAGVGISAAYVNNGSGDSSDSSIVFTYSPMDGMEVGYGTGEDGKSLDLMTAFAKYTYNNVTLAYQMSELDNAGSTADEESDAYGISLAVNENLSVSLGRHEVDMGAGNEDEESSGISASYTTGGMTITAIANSTDSVAGSANSDDSYKEVTVAFAF